MEPIWLKKSNLALLGILVQLVQKLNQNISVKHPIQKMNLVQNHTKIKQFRPTNIFPK